MEDWKERTVEEKTNIRTRTIKNQGRDSHVETKRKAENRKEWKMVANQSTDWDRRKSYQTVNTRLLYGYVYGLR